MGTTTIRVDTDTHQRLVRLGEAAGESLLQTVRDAAEALDRQRFARRVTVELDELRRDPVRWAEYLNEAERSVVADGIG